MLLIVMLGWLSEIWWICVCVCLVLCRWCVSWLMRVGLSMVGLGMGFSWFVCSGCECCCVCMSCFC